MNSLYKYKNNQICRVIHVPDVPLLTSLGIFEGAMIFKKTTFKQGGPVLIVIDTREVAIGKDFAMLIEVESCEG